MEWLRIVLTRLRALFRREAILHDIDRELRLHMELEAEANAERGLESQEARAAARRSFGNLGVIRDAAYDVRGGGAAETLLQDLRFGARWLLRRPGFTAVAVVTLALGIGANTAIYSAVNATLFPRLPVAQPENLVYGYSGSSENPYSNASYPDYAELRDENQVFSGLAAWGGIAASLNSADETDLVTGAIVSGNYFDVIGVRAALGRTITREDDLVPGAHPVAVISHGLWTRRFGASPEILGRPIELNGQGFTIVGVLPSEYRSAFPARTDDLYVPMMMQAVMRPPRAGYSGEKDPDLLRVRGNRWLWLIGRLEPGVTIEHARASLTPITDRQAALYPDTNRGRIVTLTPLDDGDPQERATLMSSAGLMLGVVGIVLLIACANVANLLLARGSARRRETAVRLALGASRGRLVRQYLTESVLLSLLGGAVGVLLASWVIGIVQTAPPPPGVLPVTLDFSLDWRVLVATVGLSVLTGLGFGLAPALQASRADVAPALKGETPAIGRGRRRLSMRDGLVILQVALCFVLLVGAGLFLRSLWRARAIEPGFDNEKLLAASLNINLLRYTRPQGREFFRQVLERVEALPGVESATLARVVQLSGNSSIRAVKIEGKDGPDEVFRSEGTRVATANPDVLSVGVVGPKYFRTMGIELVRGREFDVFDAEDKPGVVVVNETFVETHFRGQDVLGRRVGLDGPGGPWREIVGVARDSKYVSLGEAPTPFAYLPLAQNHESGMTLIVRAGGEPAGLAAAVAGAVRALDRNLPVANVRVMDDMIENSLYAARMGALLIGVFGLLALLLAAVGLYGVMAYAVSQRTREIGIRMALGARRADILNLVLREGMAVVAVGAGAGLVGAFAASRLVVSFLYGVGGTDATTYALTAAVLAAIGFVAILVPARRATKVNATVALRSE